jgi:outer membrane protein assembly factor BamB
LVATGVLLLATACPGRKTPANPTKLWEFNARTPLGAPVAAEGRIVVSAGSELLALDASGKVRWRFAPPRDHNGERVDVSEPVVADHAAYVAYAADARVTAAALALEDGRALWSVSRPAAGATSAHVHPAGRAVLVEATDASGPNLWRLDRATGAAAWGRHFSGGLEAEELAGLLAVTAQPGRDAEQGLATANPGVHVLDAATGRTLWSRKARSIVESTRTVAFTPGGVVIWNDDGTGSLTLLLLDAHTGRVLRRRTPPERFQGNSDAYDAGNIYLFDQGMTAALRYRASDLAPVGAALPFPPFARSLLRPARDDPARGYFISGDEKRVVLWSGSGVRWSHALHPRSLLSGVLGAPPTGGIATTGSTVVVSTTAGWLYAFAPAAA